MHSGDPAGNSGVNGSVNDREEEGKNGVKSTEQRGLLLTSYLVFLGDLVVYIARKTIKYKY